MVPSGSQDGGLRGPGLPGSIATESPEDLGVPGAQGPQCPKICRALAGAPVGPYPLNFFQNKKIKSSFSLKFREAALPFAIKGSN